MISLSNRVYLCFFPAFFWLVIHRFLFFLFQRVRLDWPVLASGFLKECGESRVALSGICSLLTEFFVSLFFRCSRLQWSRFSRGSAHLENSRYAKIFLFRHPCRVSLSLFHQ